MTATETTTTVVVPGTHLMSSLVGPRDQHLKQIEQAFPSTEISVRGNEVTARGERAEEVGRLFEEVVGLLQRGHVLDEASLARVIGMVGADERPSEILTQDVLRGAKGRQVRPKSAGQKRYIDAIAQNVITFGIGPAGTGKSWLAVAMAVKALQAKEVQRIILTRPAVEAGERLGFLPGDLMAKIDPYLRPLYDALYDMVEPEGAQRLLELVLYPRCGGVVDEREVCHVDPVASSELRLCRAERQHHDHAVVDRVQLRDLLHSSQRRLSDVGDQSRRRVQRFTEDG